MSFKRRVLSALKKDELLEVGRALELEVRSAWSVDELRDALAASKRAKLERLVTEALERDTLKAICEACGLDATGRDKAGLVQRILAAGGKAPRDEGKGEAVGEVAPPPAPQAGLPLPQPSAAEVAAAQASLAPTGQAKTPSKRKDEDAEAPVVSYRHGDRRKNNPDVGTVGLASDPDQPKSRWAYDPHLDPALNFDVGRAQVEDLIDGALASGEPAAMRAALEQLRRQQAPYLAWSGKAERTSFEVDTVSLHVHERIDPTSILASVAKGAARVERRKAEEAAAGRPAARRTSSGGPHVQTSWLEAPFENLPLREAMDYYKHDRGWSNRLIAGDSLLVMNSLLQKEGMAGQVQMIYIDPPYGIRYGSNFQPFVGKRDVKDGKAEDLTQEPEMIKAFRDTWELGIHSYLTYLRDRLLLARELLTESGSVFVQISDENVHLVRNLMDEVFGIENFCRIIAVTKTAGFGATLLPVSQDFLLWYARDLRSIRFRQLNLPKVAGSDDEADFGNYSKFDEFQRRYRIDNLTGQNNNVRSCLFSFDYRGRSYTTPSTRQWKTTEPGMRSLALSGRLEASAGGVYYKRLLEDFPLRAVTDKWTDTGAGGFGDDRVYVVQTGSKVIERCILMTTDPGDLVLDPTCGSGTTAVVAEKWGRRWITCDTSRVAVTLAKQRLATSSFDYYDLKYPHEGLKGGFVYKTVPHVTLKAVANNPEIDEIYERDHPAIEAALGALNAALAGQPLTFEVDEGGRKGTTLDFAKQGTALLEWEVPFDFVEQAPDDEGYVSAADGLDWPDDARGPFAAFHAARQAMQRAMDASIAAHADQETLYDQPRIDKSKLRVTGPFTVEAVPFPSVTSLGGSLDADAGAPPAAEPDAAIARSGESSRQHQWRDELLKTGVRGKGGQMLRLASLEPLPGTRYLHGVGAVADTGARVVVSFGPEHGALEQRQVEGAMREASSLFPLPQLIIFCAFVFDPEAAKDIDETRGLTALKAQMNTDLLTDDLKKARSSNQSFWLMGQPDVELTARPDGLYQIDVNGFDYYDPVKGELVSGGKSKIAMWLLDTDYDDRSLLPTQVFFPLAGAKDGWHRLKKDLRAELDESRLTALHGTRSLPFAAGANCQVAVKVVDDRGIESLKIIRLPGPAGGKA